LCVAVAPLQQSTDLGQAAQWEVGAWTEGGSVPDANIQLQSTAGAGIPTFTFGCANGNGTSACDLGAVDAGSAQRLFQAEVSLPLMATTITAVSLTVSGSAANLAAYPAASASIVVLAPGSPTVANLSPLASIAASGFPTQTQTVSPGGNAAGLFPAVTPGSQAEGASPVARVSALGGGTPIGYEMAEGAGLFALGVAMVLAITRLSWRPAPRHAANSTVPAANSTAAAAPPPEAPAEVSSKPD
jgi:hypothetical protein